MTTECVSLLITVDMHVSKGKKYILEIPYEKLSDEEQKIWLKFAMALYDPKIESDLVSDPKTKSLTVIGGLYYALKFAIAGKGGRFKDYLKTLEE
jgi:hypothetical protein